MLSTAMPQSSTSNGNTGSIHAARVTGAAISAGAAFAWRSIGKAAYATAIARSSAPTRA